MNVQRQIERLRVQRAAEWYEAMSDGEADEVQREEFAAWLAESPLNSAAYYKITALARETRAAGREARLSGRSLIHELQPELPVLGERSPATAVNRHRTLFMRWTTGLAAAAALLLVALWVVPELRTARYASGVGEERTINLTDGSVIYLNSQSRVRVALNGSSRDIHLEGEALFEVAHDATRPFRVYTHEAMVRAVGTQFNVATRPDGTQIAVVEGKVQVSSDKLTMSRIAELFGAHLDRATPAPLGLVAGQAARVLPTGIVERRPDAEAANALAWREHLVIFEGTSLAEAIEELNKQHRSPRLRLEDVAPGTHHYSGTFDANDPASFADFLAREPDLIVERHGDEIVIRGRRSQPAVPSKHP
jgi:transmembrane sensor